MIPQGRFMGQPFKLFPWQRRFLRGAFGQPDDAALTLGRGGGKTTFIAALAAACVDGPLAEPNAESLIVASSFDQGLICWRHILRLLAPVLERDGQGRKGRWRVQDSANRATLEDRNTGAMLRVLGSDPKRLHGAAPRLLIGDELAQWPPGQIDAMLSALETSRGKISDSRALWIGTRPAAPEHPFERYLRGGVGYSQIHAALPADAPFQRKTWKKANPGLDGLPDLESIIRREAAAARRDPARLASFKALRLNLGTSDVERQYLLSAEVWREIEGQAEREGRCFWGVDLGTSAAQSAVAAYWPDTGRLECLAAFPSIPSLAERGQADGVGPLYTECARRGELLTLGENAADVGALLSAALDRFGPPKQVASDRWREAELRDVLKGVGIGAGRLDLRGMGFKDGGEDVRHFTRACLEGRVTPVPSLLLTAAMSEARTLIDPAGNAKLAKGSEGGRRLNARDDAAAAGILVVGLAERQPKRTSGVYIGLGGVAAFTPPWTRGAGGKCAGPSWSAITGRASSAAATAMSATTASPCSTAASLMTGATSRYFVAAVMSRRHGQRIPGQIRGGIVGGRW